MGDQPDAQAAAARVGVAMVVGDGPRRARVIASLTSPTIDVRRFESIEDLRSAVGEVSIDVVVTDRFGSGGQTNDVLRGLLALRTPPVIVIAPTGIVGVEALEAGAADYVVEPFAERELRARALLRADRLERSVLDHGDLVIDRAAPRVTVAGVDIDLTAREFDLLAFFAERPQLVMSREVLLEQVWGVSAEWLNPATVTEHVYRLRRKIAQVTGEKPWITTVRGVGYRFDP